MSKLLVSRKYCVSIHRIQVEKEIEKTKEDLKIGVKNVKNRVLS